MQLIHKRSQTPFSFSFFPSSKNTINSYECLIYSPLLVALLQPYICEFWVGCLRVFWLLRSTTLVFFPHLFAARTMGWKVGSAVYKYHKANDIKTTATPFLVLLSAQTAIINFRDTVTKDCGDKSGLTGYCFIKSSLVKCQPKKKNTLCASKVAFFLPKELVWCILVCMFLMQIICLILYVNSSRSALRVIMMLIFTESKETGTSIIVEPQISQWWLGWYKRKVDRCLLAKGFGKDKSLFQYYSPVECNRSSL